MADRVCPQCGAPIDPNATECKFCGEKLVTQQAAQQTQPQQAQPQQAQPQPQQMYTQAPQPQIVIQQAPPQQVYVTGINPAWPIKNKLVAALLAIFLGDFGVHKFYLGQAGSGVVYLLFCWTGFPAIIGFIEGIAYLCSNDENFQLKHHVRLS